MALEQIIRKVEPVTASDPRGKTYEWCRGILGLQISIYERKAGHSFGGHFHTGIDHSKNPERFFLIIGKLECCFIDGYTDELFTAEVSEGNELIIPARVLHYMKALTDSIFIEYRPTMFDKSNPDSFPAERYEEFIDSSKYSKIGEF